MDIVCILTDKNTNYVIGNNELIHKTNNKILTCKFNKIIHSEYRMYSNYYSEIIRDIKDNSLKVPVEKKTSTVILLGEHNLDFSYLIGKTIEEFMYEEASFNFYIHEIKSNGVFDLILNKHIDMNIDKATGLEKTKIFFDGFDKTTNKKKMEIVDIIEYAISSKKEISYIVCTFENKYNKLSIYNLSDLENIIEDKNKDNVNYKNYFALIDYGFMKSALLKVDNENKIMEESNLMNYFLPDIKFNTKIIYNITKPAAKTWNLVNLFYEYTNNSALVPYKNYVDKPFDIIKANKINQGFIPKYNKTNNILKPNKPIETVNSHYKILNKPSFFNLNKHASNLIKYNAKYKKNLPSKSAKYISDYDSESDTDNIASYKEDQALKNVFEIIKYVPEPENPVLTFDKLMIYNKFIFDHTVKTHITLQKANREPAFLAQTNMEVMSELKAMLTVMLDQINNL